MPWLRDLNDLSFIQKCKQSPFQPEEWIPGSMPRRRRESGETDTCTPPKRFCYNLRWGLWYINGHRFTLAPFCTWMLFNILVITIAHLSYLEKGGEITINCDMRKIIIFTVESRERGVMCIYGSLIIWVRVISINWSNFHNLKNYSGVQAFSINK